MSSIFGGTAPSPLRSKNARRRRLLAVLPALGALAIGVSAAAGQSQDKPVLTIGNSNLNACIASKVTPLFNDSGSNFAAYETLFEFHGYDKPFTSNVLRSWKSSGGNKLFTMTLKPNIHFSDGTLLDGAAIKGWVEWRAKQAAANFGNAYIGGGPLGDVTVLSKYTVRVRTQSPVPNFPLAFGNGAGNWGNIVSPKAVAEVTANPASPIFTQGSYGFGPYVFDAADSVLGDHCTYVPNKYYYNKKKQAWSKVVVRVFADPNAELAAAQTGQVDVMLLASPNIQAAAKAAGLKVFSIPRLYTFISIRDHNGNTTPAIKDKRVRQAMSYAIDRNAILQSVFSGVGSATSSPDPGSDGDSKKLTNYYPYNPAKAKQLLAAAGYPGGFTIQVFSPQGGFGFGLDAEQAAVCKYWGDVGIKCDIHSFSASAAGANLFVRGWDAAIILDGVNPMSIWYGNYMLPTSLRGDPWGWFDPVSNKMFQAARRQSAKQSAAAWHTILGRVVSEAYHIGLTTYPGLRIVNKRVGGTVGNQTGEMYGWTSTGK
jgi:peptide/nickel transport system substrate-binding protein